jgi:hypothetical protein
VLIKWCSNSITIKKFKNEKNEQNQATAIRSV